MEEHQISQLRLLSEGLNELYLADELFDVVLEVDGQPFHAHRCVLAASSPYFRAMFCNNFCEASSKLVKIKGLSSQAMKTLLNFVYTVNLPLEDDNVYQLLRAAHLLQFQVAVKRCEDYLISNMSAKQCLFTFNIAEELQLGHLKEVSKTFLQKNLPDVSKTPLFLQISKDILVSLLSSSDTLGAEVELFKAAEQWLLYDYLDRKEFAMDIISLIRLGLLSSKEGLTSVMASDLMVDKRLRSYCSDVFKVNFTKSQYPYPVENLGLPRDTEMSVCCLGGFDDGWEPGTVNIGVTANGKTCNLPPSPVREIGESVSITVGHFVYIFGGFSYFPNDFEFMKGPSGATFRYNIQQNKWEDMASMKEARIKACGCRVGSHIVLAGGENYGRIYSSVEYYDLKKDEWTTLPDLLQPTKNAAACSLMGNVYISGGESLDMPSSLLQKYNPITRSWNDQAYMIRKRVHHAMSAVDDCLIVAGGMPIDTEISSSEGPVLVLPILPVEVYNRATNQWSTASVNMGFNTKYSCMVSLGSKVLFAGCCAASSLFLCHFSLEDSNKKNVVIGEETKIKVLKEYKYELTSFAFAHLPRSLFRSE